MFIVHRIVFALNGIAALLLLLSYVAPYISPELFWPVAFLGLGYPVLLLINLCFVIYWIAFFRIKFLVSLVVIAAGFKYIPYFVQLNAKKTADKANSISLMSFNMRYFGAFEGKKIEDPDKFFTVFDKLNPDIICLQECENFGTKIEAGMYKTFYKKIKNYHTYWLYDHEKGFKTADGLLIASRYPIIRSAIVEREDHIGNFTMFSDVLAYGDTVRIINTHLRSIKFEGKEYAAVKDVSFDNDSTVGGYKSITKKLKFAFIKRAKQAQAIREFILASPYPVVVCGDFNDSPTSYAYSTVKGNLKDAFCEAGSGLGRTYVGAMPSFRIDYILLDPSFGATNYYAKSFEFSDHKMISCNICIRQKE